MGIQMLFQNDPQFISPRGVSLCVCLWMIVSSFLVQPHTVYLGMADFLFSIKGDQEYLYHVCSNNFTYFPCVLIQLVSLQVYVCAVITLCVWHRAVRIRVSGRCCDTIWAEAHKAVATHHTPDVSHAHTNARMHTHTQSIMIYKDQTPTALYLQLEP